MFTNTDFSLFAFILVPFAAYSIRRYVVTTLDYSETEEESYLKTHFCPCNSLAQDIHEMKIRRIGAYREDGLPIIDEDQI